MGIKEKEDALFSRWALSHSGFVCDGLADEIAYLASGIKTLFVFSEIGPLEPDGETRDLRQYMREGGRPQGWNNITRWVESIRRYSECIPWTELSIITQERRVKALCSIGVVSLQKSLGRHTAVPSMLMQPADEDRASLNEQFDLYDADLIVCCGEEANRLFHDLIEKYQTPDWKTTSRGVQYHEPESGKFIVSYLHPEERVADSLLYYGFSDAIKALLGGR